MVSFSNFLTPRAKQTNRARRQAIDSIIEVSLYLPTVHNEQDQHKALLSPFTTNRRWTSSREATKARKEMSFSLELDQGFHVFTSLFCTVQYTAREANFSEHVHSKETCFE